MAVNVDAGILIVEDEVLIAEYLKDTLISLGFNDIRLAHTKKDALESIASAQPALLLLDIRMEHELDGISIAQTMLKTEKIPFIFITAHSDKDIIQQALETQPSAYLTKPFKKMDVFASVCLALTPTNSEPKKFIFKDGHTTVSIFCSDILYVESECKYITVVTEEKKYTLRNSLEWCLKNLPENIFIRVHRSFIVNTEKIETKSSKSITIKNKIIPVSRFRSQQVDLTPLS
jgi:two-component system response regulator LytT